MKLTAAAAAGFILTASLPFVTGYFILPCNGPLDVERLDPIVSPDAVSTHVHTVFGGNGFNASMDYNTARASTCSSCKAKADLSNYWVPHMYYKAQNGSFHIVKNYGARVYYLFRPGPGEKLQPFPEGLRMVAGDPKLRTYKDTPEQRAVSFVCLRYDGGNQNVPGTGEQHSIHDVNRCPDGYRAQVFFPSCWDGKNVDSADHKAHVSYPEDATGKCPSSHPVKLISLFYEVFFETPAWSHLWYDPDHHPFVFSNGDPTGYGFHGDAFLAWDVDVLRRAIAECDTDAFQGDIKRCAPLTLFSDDDMDDCVVAPRVDEPITGWLDKLPGCNMLDGDTHECHDNATVGPPKRYDTDVSKLGWSYVGCAGDRLDSRTLPARHATDDMTVEKCVNYCASKNYAFAGLEYATECWCGNSVANERLNRHKCRMPCAGNPDQYCGDALKLSLYQKTSASAPSIGARHVTSHRMKKRAGHVHVQHETF